MKPQYEIIDDGNKHYALVKTDKNIFGRIRKRFFSYSFWNYTGGLIYKDKSYVYWLSHCWTNDLKALQDIKKRIES